MTPDDQKVSLELLGAQYSEMRKETLLQLTSIKTHVRNSHIVISAIVSIALALFSFEKTTLSPSYAWFWFFLMLLATTVTFYLFHAVMDSVYSMNIMGGYLTLLEEQVNDLAPMKVMNWETVACKEILHKGMPFRGVLSPIPVMNVYPNATILAVGTIVPLWFYARIWAWWPEPCQRIALLLAGLYSVGSLLFAAWVWWGANMAVRDRTIEYLRTRIEKPQSA